MHVPRMTSIRKIALSSAKNHFVMHHIDDDKLNELLDRFNFLYPNGDFVAMARFMYDHGFEDGMSQTCDLF